ncbi:MAG TPA: PKD domain-containing protein, partial [Cytophagaceae bacterium]
MINFQSIKLLVGLLSFQLITSIHLSAQSPYSLSNEWRFGSGAGLSFPSGDFPDSGAPTSVGSNAGTDNVETSTSISDKSGNVALYTNTLEVRNIANSAIRNLITDNTCAGSATGGAVAIPDPASPNDTYYLFIANDITGGGCAAKGVNYYKFQMDGNGEVIYLSGPVNIAAGTFADESITAGNDGRGNYWIVAHAYASNTFKVWKVDQTGVTALADQSKPEVTPNVNTNQSYSKISPCQDKIAWFGGGKLLVYEFNRLSGTIGNLLLDKSGLGHSVGVEFSPNGQFIYYSGQGSTVSWFNIATGTTGTIAGSASWTMQLGPDAKIYTSPSGNSVGVIDDPDNPTTSSYSNISLGGGSMFRGISNLAWLSPEPPQINYTNSTVCSVDLEFNFKNYFHSDIAINTSSVSWDFGDGSTSPLLNPSHTYDNDGKYTVKLTFEDATCGHTFTDSIEVTISSCNVVSPTCTYNLEAIIDPVNNVVLNETDPVTVNLNGSNSIFDNSVTHAEKYYWVLGSADTTQAFSTSDNTTLTFAYNGQGGHLSQGSYEVYLI